MSQVLEPEPIEEQHGFFKQYVKIAGRKARCALCHGKILVDAPYSINNGLICHDACIEETKNLDNNVRRRTLKLMGIGAAFAGATAIGASRLVSASGVQQTQITANGVILPSLTSDPANPEPGQMWYRSDAGVTAHFDAIENRVIYSNRIVNGSEVVSSKGIANGLSVLPNDGQDWGPDTMLGATAPGQYGSPYTETLGIQEGYNSLHTVYNSVTQTYIKQGTVHLLPGTYDTYAAISISSAGQTAIIGEPAIGWNASSISESETLQTVLIRCHNTTGLTTFGNVFLQCDNSLGSQNYAGGGFNLENVAVIAMNEVTSANGGGQLSIINLYTMSTVYINNVYVGFTTLQTTNDNVIGLYTSDPAGDMFTIGRMTFQLASPDRTIALQISSNHFYAEVLEITATNPTQGNNPQPSLIWSSGAGNGNNAYISQIYFGYDLYTLINVSQGYAAAEFLISDCAVESAPTPYFVNNGAANLHIQSLIVVPGQTVTTSLTSTGVVIIDKMYGAANTPTISANPPASGTVYQNTNPYDIEIDLPVYAATAGTAGYVTIAKGSSSTPTAIGNQYVNGATSSTSTDIIKLRVPAGWYYSFTASGVTFGTASVFAD